MRFFVMFVTAVCVLFLIKLRWPKKKNFYDNVNPVFFGYDVQRKKPTWEFVFPWEMWHLVYFYQNWIDQLEFSNREKLYCPDVN